jgi:hypothetical protein
LSPLFRFRRCSDSSESQTALSWAPSPAHSADSTYDRRHQVPSNVHRVGPERLLTGQEPIVPVPCWHRRTEPRIQIARLRFSSFSSEQYRPFLTFSGLRAAHGLPGQACRLVTASCIVGSPAFCEVFWSPSLAKELWPGCIRGRSVSARDYSGRRESRKWKAFSRPAPRLSPAFCFSAKWPFRFPVALTRTAFLM